MTRNLDFFDRLYQGFEAENLVAGKIFASGLEAFKLPGDFGFDLLVSNQFELLKANEELTSPKQRDLPFPYVLQIKSRRAGNLTLNQNQRGEVAVDFFINESEYRKIVENRSAFLVCVAFLPIPSGELVGKPLIFWADGKWLKCARDCGYLRAQEINGNRLLKITLVYRSKPSVSASGILEELSCRMLAEAKNRLAGEDYAAIEASFGKLIREAANSLSDQLPVGYEAKEYVSMVRPVLDFTNACGKENETVVQVPNAQLDLANLGCLVEFGKFDSTGAKFIKECGPDRFLDH